MVKNKVHQAFLLKVGFDNWQNFLQTLSSIGLATVGTLDMDPFHAVRHGGGGGPPIPTAQYRGPEFPGSVSFFDYEPQGCSILSTLSWFGNIHNSAKGNIWFCILREILVIIWFFLNRH